MAELKHTRKLRPLADGKLRRSRADTDYYRFRRSPNAPAIVIPAGAVLIGYLTSGGRLSLHVAGVEWADDMLRFRPHWPRFAAAGGCREEHPWIETLYPKRPK